MQLKKHQRKLAAKELRLLKLISKNRENELKSKNHLRIFLVSLIIGITFAFIASKLEDGFLLFLTGTIAVFAFAFFVFSIAPTIKERAVDRKFVRDLNIYIQNGLVSTSVINALNIAEAIEYEDESTLYIIEFEKDKILFYWDLDYSLYDKFPCLNFEIYDDEYYKFTNRQINFLSNKIDVELIDKNKKWNYLKKNGAPGHLEIINRNFENLVKEMKSNN